MIKVTYGGGEGVDDEEFLNSKPDERKWDIFEGSVNDIFHPMIAEVGGKTHLLDRVMDFVKFPEKGNSMEEAVDIPVDEVSYDK